MNQEFKKHFSTCNFIPIVRVVETKRYWINKNLLIVKANKTTFNIAQAAIEIIDKYIVTKKSAFDNFIKTSEQFKTIEKVVEKYMDCIEEIINIDRLKKSLDKVEKENNLSYVLTDIIKQSKVEFNYENEE